MFVIRLATAFIASATGTRKPENITSFIGNYAGSHKQNNVEKVYFQ